MKINKNSEIKSIINNNTIGKIQNINPNFQKLETWTINKYATTGVIIKDFVKLGKVTVNEFLKTVEKFGFEVELDTQTNQNANDADEINLENLKIVTLDVRPSIASGIDPFQVIMKGVGSLKEDETLQIINVFVPVPLINVLKGKGFKSWTNTISDKEYHTFFTKVDLSTHSIIKTKDETLGNFDEKLSSFGSKIKEIDVRQLEMPEPMVTILEELETLTNDYVLLVNHKKVPQFLLPELETRNYKWMSKDIEAGYVLFIVFK